MYRLMILLFFIDDICYICHKTCLDIYVKHTFYYKEFQLLNIDMTLFEMSF